MEQRTSYHDTHNRLVTIFLRKLEYYQGIFSLTTNRMIQFDEAIISRIHLTIKYEDLTREFRREIWKNQLSKACTIQDPAVVRDDELQQLDSYGSTEDIRRRAQWEGQRKVLQLLDKRTDEKQDSFVCFDGVTKVVVRFWRQGYPSSGQWATSDPIYDEALDNQEVECTNTETSIETIVLTDNSDYHTEHIIELQSMPMFFAWLVANSKCQVDCDFFTNFFNKDILTGTTPLPGGYNSGTPSLRIMEALGSWTNDKQFRMLQKRLNGMEA